MVEHRLSVESLNDEGLVLASMGDFHYPTLDHEHLFRDVSNFEQVASFLIVNSLEFEKDFMLGMMRKKLKVTD